MPPPILARPAFLRATVTNFFFSALNGFVLLPLYIQQLGGTEVEVGLVMGLYSALGIVCQPLVGAWVDAVGRKPFMVLGVAVVLGTAVLAMVAGAIPWLALLRALQGVGFSAFFVANYSYVLDLVRPEERGWALGIYGVSGLLATALTPLAGEWLIRRFGFPPFFGACAGLAAVAAALVWPLRERARSAPVMVPARAWARAGLRELARRHMALTAFFGLGTGVLFTFVPTFGEALGIRTLALFYTAYAGAAMGVRVFGGRLIDTAGRRAVIVPSMFLQAAGSALLAGMGLLAGRAAPGPLLAAVGLVCGGAHGFLYPALAALVADQAPEARRGAVVGLFSAVFLVGNAGGAFVFGYVTHALGYGAMWSLLAALLLVGAGLSLGLAEPPLPAPAPRVAGG